MRTISISKRQKFILSSILLSVGFIGIQILDDRFKFLGIGVLGMLTLITFYLSLREGLGLNSTLLILILPIYFTVGVGLFFFLLPYSLFSRIPIILVYGVGVYALFLTSNIFTVAAIRTIALLRAARGVSFVLILFSFFLIFDAILSLRAQFYITALLVMLSSFPLFIIGYWTSNLKEKLNLEIILLTSVSSIILAEISLALFFWPVTVVVGSLFLTIAVYILMGLGQSKLEGRLFSQTVREYLTVGAIVFLGMFLSTRWGG